MLAVWPSVNTSDSTVRTAGRRSARWASVGGANTSCGWTSPSARRAFARLMRWATVGSGSRSPWAISAVVRPPTARRVSATWLGGRSAG